jgi:hypothetical protein
MKLYRVKQFFWGLVARLTESDISFVNNNLDEHELKLFFKLPKNEQLHSVKVARIVGDEIKARGINDRNIIKAALLHDIGKIESGLNIFSKSIMVLGDKYCPKLLSKFIRFKVVNAYYNHPEIALTYLSESDEAIKYYILNHHNYSICEDEVLKIIQNADSKS